MRPAPQTYCVEALRAPIQYKDALPAPTIAPAHLRISREGGGGAALGAVYRHTAILFTTEVIGQCPRLHSSAAASWQRP